MRNLLTSVMFLGAMAGCGVNDSTVGSSDDLADSAELSTSSRTFVAVRPDLRACAAPMCGGYWVHDVNRTGSNETYVSSLELGSSGLTADDQRLVTDALGEVVLRGKLGPKVPHHQVRPFVVSEAWRGLPGLSAGAGDAFYKVHPVSVQCVRAPCPTMSAVQVNHTPATLLHQLTLSLPGFVDHAWLEHRLLDDDAIAMGSLARVGDKEVLTATNVYLKLPETVGPCPAWLVSRCAAGTERTYTRNTDRCQVADQCVTPGVCAQFVPSCGAGYTATSWKVSPNACPAVACDPSWLFE